MNGWACSIAGIHCGGTFLSLLPSARRPVLPVQHTRKSQFVVRRIAALLHERPDDVIEGRPEIGDHVREGERQLRRRKFPNHEPDHEPPRRIGFAAYRVRHRGYPLVQGAVPCRAVLLGPRVLDPQCVETIHGGSLPPTSDSLELSRSASRPCVDCLGGVVYGFAIGRARTARSDAVRVFGTGAGCRRASAKCGVCCLSLVGPRIV